MSVREVLGHLAVIFTAGPTLIALATLLRNNGAF